MLSEQPRGDKRVDYLVAPDQESTDILEFKKVCSVMLGDLYGLARLRKGDMRGMADFQGKLMTLFQLVRGEMVESEIKDKIEVGIDTEGKPVFETYFKYREMAYEIDRIFTVGFDMKMGQRILEKINEFIRASGIIKKNIPRYVLQ